MNTDTCNLNLYARISSLEERDSVSYLRKPEPEQMCARLEKSYNVIPASHLKRVYFMGNMGGREKSAAIREYLQQWDQPSQVDSQEAAVDLNRSLGLRGQGKITPRNIAAVKAHLTRAEIAQADDSEVGSKHSETTLAREQMKLARVIAKSGNDQEMRGDMRQWNRLMLRCGSLEKAIQLLARQAELISSLDDSPKNALNAILSARQK